MADSPGNFENVWDNPGKEDIYEKEDQKNPVTGHIVLILMAMMPVQAQAANRTATTVRMKTYYKSGKKFMTVRGLDSRSRLVWKYTTKSYPATELKQITCLVRADKVYVFDEFQSNCISEKRRQTFMEHIQNQPAGHIFRF